LKNKKNRIIKFNKNTKARTLATSIIKTFRYRLIASSVELNLERRPRLVGWAIDQKSDLQPIMIHWKFVAIGCFSTIQSIETFNTTDFVDTGVEEERGTSRGIHYWMHQHTLQ